MHLFMAHELTTSAKWAVNSVKRNRLNVNWSKSLVYVHYNLRLLSHYCEEAKMNKILKSWDNNPEEDNLEDEVLFFEQLENALMDDDDRVEIIVLKIGIDTGTGRGSNLNRN
jgi:hypothetical protein